MNVAVSICDLAPCGIIRSGVASAAQDAAGSVFDVFEGLLRDGAGWLLHHVLDALLSPSRLSAITLSDSWFVDEANVMLAITLAVVAPMLLVATIGAILHQDLRRLIRAWAVALPIATVCGVLGVGLTSYALDLSEALCQLVLRHGPPLSHAVDQLIVALATPGLPQMVACLVCMLLFFGAMLLWLELVVRAAAVYVAVFFLPLTLAGLIWPASARMAKRMVELLVSLILSKFVIVATLTLGATAVVRGSGPDSALIGGTILVLAAFAPFAVLRLIPVVEVAAIGHLEGISRRPWHAAKRGARSAESVVSGNPVLALVRTGGSRGKESAPPPSPVRPHDVATRPGWYRATEGSHGPGPVGAPDPAGGGGPSEGAASPTVKGAEPMIAMAADPTIAATADRAADDG